MFDNDTYRDVFDGTIYANGAVLGIREDRIVFNGESGHTSYRSSSTDTNGNVTIQRLGERLLNKKCDSVIVSCCYDSQNNTDTADETYRCLIVAPANTSDDAANIIAAFDSSGHLEQFDTWNFE